MAWLQLRLDRSVSEVPGRDHGDADHPAPEVRPAHPAHAAPLACRSSATRRDMTGTHPRPHISNGLPSAQPGRGQQLFCFLFAQRGSPFFTIHDRVNFPLHFVAVDGLYGCGSAM